ncbi:MAG: hypothetical protein EBZ67_05565, partial [Chitinophagia bacterium]|nr:hypothetical protein [Chitinophagia bacterium]
MIEDDGVIRSDGTSILGADDKGGMAPAIEAVLALRESGLPHGDVYLLLSVAEEIGLLGASVLKIEDLNLDYGYVLDTGPPVGTFVTRTATHDHLRVFIEGKPAHAGKDPEHGINAIQVLADAVTRMKLGRIGPENGLQTHYTSGILASPMITGGVGVEHDVDGTGRLFVNSSLTANAALGPGLSSARARVGLTAFPTSWLRVDAAAHLDAVHVQSSSLDFAHLNGVRPGWEVRLEGTSSRYVTPFVKVEYGGLKNDFNYLIGFSIP